MLKTHRLERQLQQRSDCDRLERSAFLRHGENRLEIRERGFGLAVCVDDVAELLQRSEDEEGIDEQRKELPDGDLLRVDLIEHQEQDAGPEKVDRRALDEAQAPEI